MPETGGGVLPAAPPAPANGAAIVAQLQVQPGAEAAFAAWQDKLQDALRVWPGFVQQSVLPPTPPVDIRWTIFQWFSSNSAAEGWLASPERKQLLADAHGILTGPDEIHFTRARAQADASQPASLVIATRVRPEAIDGYRDWQYRIATALSGSPGFQGYRIDPPVPGLREDWLIVVRFDSEDHLQDWIASPLRNQFLKESEQLTLTTSVRSVPSAFEQWFPAERHSGETPPWKMSMLVLSVLYPAVFLIDTFIAGRLLHAGIAEWLTIFVGNVICVITLGILVPKVARLFGWWLVPGDAKGQSKRDVEGVCAVLGLYAAALLLAGLYDRLTG